MQSPEKLRQRLDALLGPPGPEADPIELVLRTVVATTAPMIEGVLDQHSDESLDQGLEHVALFFLNIRSDGQPFSREFLQELGRLATTEAPHDAQAAPEELAAAPAEPAAPSAPAAPAAPDTPAPSSPPVPPAAAPSSPDTPPAESPGSTDTPPPAAPAAPSEPPAPSSSEERPPAPPWGG